MSKDPDLGVYGDARAIAGTGSGRMTGNPQVIPGQKSASGKFVVARNYRD
ncbi:MAG TPA: hypothetical protein VEG68_09180 [Terriglobales bacterium]|nr:hypothetical protein [Terriglobales bacterium]